MSLLVFNAVMYLPQAGQEIPEQLEWCFWNASEEHLFFLGKTKTANPSERGPTQLQNPSGIARGFEELAVELGRTSNTTQSHNSEFREA